MTAEDLLTRTLREVTEHTDYPATPPGTVRARPRVARARSRRTAVLAAAAAVALVAGSTAWWLGRSPDTSPQPSHELSSGPTSSPTVGTSLASLPLGRPPRIDYVDGDTLIGASGANLTATVFSTAYHVASARGGYVTSSPLPAATPGHEPGLARLWLVAPDGVQPLGCGSPRFAVSPDGVESAYWRASSCGASRSGRLYAGVTNTMGQSPTGSVPTGGDVFQPVGFLPAGEVVVNDLTRRTVRIVAPGGTITTVPGMSSAAGVAFDRGAVAGTLTDGTDAVVEAATGTVLWHAAGWHLGQFSSDGRFLVAWRSVGGTTRYAISDARHGDQATSLDSLGQAVDIRQIAWDQSDTLLAVVTDARREAIVRFDRSGHATLAAPIRSVTGSQPGYRLATRP